MNPTQHSTLLVVDDDDVYRQQLSRSLRRRGYRVAEAKNGEQAIELVKKHRFSRSVIDLNMPGIDGLQTLNQLLKHQPEMQAVLVTGWSSVATAVDAVRLGAINYIAKPATAADILAAFERGLQEPATEVQDTHTPLSLARAEWEHIQRVLRETDQNISEAARRLKIPRRTLQRKLQKYPPSD